MYKVFEPKKGVLEQVLGFGLPFEKGGAETPKDQFLSRDCVFNFFLLGISRPPFKGRLLFVSGVGSRGATEAKFAKRIELKNHFQTPEVP